MELALWFHSTLESINLWSTDISVTFSTYMTVIKFEETLNSCWQHNDRECCDIGKPIFLFIVCTNEVFFIVEKNSFYDGPRTVMRRHVLSLFGVHHHGNFEPCSLLVCLLSNIQLHTREYVKLSSPYNRVCPTIL